MTETEKEILKAAKKKVKLKKKFYSDFAIFCLVALGATAFVLYNGFALWWILVMTFGWGFQIISDYIKIFGLPWKGEDWEEMEIEKERQRLERQQGIYNNYDDEPNDSLMLREIQKEKNWDDKDIV